MRPAAVEDDRTPGLQEHSLRIERKVRTNTMVKFLSRCAFSTWLPGPTILVMIGLIALSGGCGRDEVRVYRVPKEQPKAGLANLPAGWEPAPLGEMRFASFRIKGDNGKTAEVSVIPLPGMAGDDLANVNRWRGQVNLAPVSEGEMAKQAESVEIGGEPAKLFDQAGQPAGSSEKTRIVAAILRREGAAWFFKMTGEDATVAKQKPAFVEYLKTFDFTKSASGSETAQTELPPSHPAIGSVSAGPSTQSSAANSGSDRPEWKVPSGWKETSSGPFLVAKFLIEGGGNARAAVNVSMSAGNGGGLVANVNRWRGQLGLGDSSETDINKVATSVDIPAGKATFIDMSGTDTKTGEKARIVGAMLPRTQKTWFFKLMGPEQLVQQNKDDFQKFVESTKFPE